MTPSQELRDATFRGLDADYVWLKNAGDHDPIFTSDLPAGAFDDNFIKAMYCLFVAEALENP